MFAIATVTTFVLLQDEAEDLARVRAAERVVTELLPPASAPVAELRATLRAWHDELGLDLTVRDAQGVALANAGGLARAGSRAECVCQRTQGSHDRGRAPA